MSHFSIGKNGVIFMVVVSFIFFGFLASAGAEKSVSLPKTMIWSCYDVGASGYVQASAIADAFVKKYGIRVRLLPSGTSIGRLMPLTTGRVSCGFLANEVFFAVEGLYDFSTIEWGPQDLRVLLAHPTTIALATTKESGIKTIKNLKGKRVSWIPGAPTLNIKAEAFLAFGGLTWNDVNRVEFPSYGAACKALIEGKTDASVVSTSASTMYELETSPRGLFWAQFPPSDKEGWDRMLKIAPFLSPKKETIGAGISKENPVYLPGYRYPMITVYANADPEWVYNFVKALDQTYPTYEKAHAVMPDWKISESGVPPADAPFHVGAIKYLKEKGVWTAKDDEWNKARIEHLKKVQKAWEKTVAEAEAKKIKSKEFPEFWLKQRAEALGE
ncbi:MAG: TAXI family TRAP transporter solute-binding subunit [Pseudomonadota bacterium]